MFGCSNTCINTRNLVFFAFVHEEFSLNRMELLLMYTAVKEKSRPEMLCDLAGKRQEVTVFL